MLLFDFAVDTATERIIRLRRGRDSLGESLEAGLI